MDPQNKNNQEASGKPPVSQTKTRNLSAGTAAREFTDPDAAVLTSGSLEYSEEDAANLTTLEATAEAKTKIAQENHLLSNAKNSSIYSQAKPEQKQQTATAKFTS